MAGFPRYPKNWGLTRFFTSGWRPRACWARRSAWPSSSYDRVLEANGFHREGHLRSYLSFATRRADALMYSFLASDLVHEYPRNDGV